MRRRIEGRAIAGSIVVLAFLAAGCELVVGSGDYSSGDAGSEDLDSSTSVPTGSGSSSGTGVPTGSGSSGTSVPTGSGGSSGGASVCVLAPNSCTGGQTCLAVEPSSGTFSSDCASPGTAAQGASCTLDSDCVAGMGCFGPSGSSTCSPWCQLSPTSSACPSGTTCQPVDPAEVIGDYTYGACLFGGVAAFTAGTWDATVVDSAPDCNIEDETSTETVTYGAAGASGLTLTNDAGCTLDWTVSGATATMTPNTECDYTDETTGIYYEQTYVSDQWVLTSATTATISVTYTLYSYIDGESETCDYTRTGTATLE